MFWAGEPFGAGVGGMDQVPPARDNNGPASMVKRRAELVVGLLVAERCGSATTQLDSFAPYRPSRTRV